MKTITEKISNNPDIWKIYATLEEHGGDQAGVILFLLFLLNYLEN